MLHSAQRFLAAAALAAAAAFPASALGPRVNASAVAPTPDRGYGYPALSAVSFSSRFYRPRDSADPFNTFRDGEQFFPTRLDWVYDRGNMGDIVPRAQDRGWTYSLTLNHNLPDRIGTADRNIGRDVDFNGNPTVNGNPGTDVRIGDIWSEDYFNIAVARLELAIPLGADAIHVDDPGGSYFYATRGDAGYGEASNRMMCEYLRERTTPQQRMSWGLWPLIPSTFDYAGWVRSQGGESRIDPRLKAFHEQMLLDGLYRFYDRIRARAAELNGGVPVPMSCNNTSNVVWTEEHAWADWGMAETRLNNISPRQIRTWIRNGESREAGQVLLAPRFDAPAPPADYVDRVRRAIATAYAMGGVMQVPWDLFQLGFPTRYFGTPAEYADLYGFVRAIPAYLDGYEEVAARGSDFNVNRVRTGFPIMQSTGGSGDMVLSLRAVPGNSARPLMLHMVDWGTPAASTLVLDPNQLFDGRPFVAHLFEPAPYDAAAHAQARQTGRFTALRTLRFLPQTTRTDGRIEIQVPAVRPWAVVRLFPR